MLSQYTETFCHRVTIDCIRSGPDTTLNKSANKGGLGCADNATCSCIVTSSALPQDSCGSVCAIVTAPLQYSDFENRTRSGGRINDTCQVDKLQRGGVGPKKTQLSYMDKEGKIVMKYCVTWMGVLQARKDFDTEGAGIVSNCGPVHRIT
jgi:hypothetical protein